ncbi:MAG: ankyrin repeat domain-containing protein, partial [Verrucomicrobiales bacterium]|nr:ankyrin repeat domain-containing protein [Verrucomicrobiales bacterium]
MTCAVGMVLLFGRTALATPSESATTTAPAPAPSPATLASAEEASDLARVQALLKQRADVNGAQADGMTALHWAAWHDDVALARILLRAKADPGRTNLYG